MNDPYWAIDGWNLKSNGSNSQQLEAATVAGDDVDAPAGWQASTGVGETIKAVIGSQMRDRKRSSAEVKRERRHGRENPQPPGWLLLEIGVGHRSAVRALQVQSQGRSPRQPERPPARPEAERGHLHYGHRRHRCDVPGRPGVRV